MGCLLWVEVIWRTSEDPLEGVGWLARPGVDPLVPGWSGWSGGDGLDGLDGLDFLDFSSTHSISIYTADFEPLFGIRQIAIAMGGVYDIWLFDMIIFNISIWLLEVQATDRYPSFCHRLLRIIRKYRCFEIW